MAGPDYRTRSTGTQQPIRCLALSQTLRASIWAWLKTMSSKVAKDSVTMNGLAPRTIHTDVSATVLVRRRNVGSDDYQAERLADVAAQIPAGRVGTPGEYVGAV